MCGDGKIDYLKYEKCDDGNTENEDGCDENCQIEKHFKCKEDKSLRSVCWDDRPLKFTLEKIPLEDY